MAPTGAPARPGLALAGQVVAEEDRVDDVQRQSRIVPEYRAGTGPHRRERQGHIPNWPEEAISTTGREQWPESAVQRSGMLQEDKIV